MPGDVSLSGIEFQIKGSSNGASDSINRLINLLNRLKDALSRLTSANNIKTFFGTLRKDVSGLSGVFKEVSSTLLGIGKSGAKGFFNALSLPVKAATKNVSGLAKSLSGVLGGFKRILGYRIIRAVIKEITQAFQEGIKNLYGWSSAFGGATINGMNFAQTMNSLATSFLYFKNAVGAAVSPLISALAPAIDFVIDKVVALLNVLNQLFARLAGATSWNKAIKKATEYEEAAGGAGAAAKEAMKYLAPFDELNRLPSDNGSGGGGGGGTDYSGMFEEATEFNEDIANFADSLKAAIEAGDWQGVGTLLGNKVNEIVDSIDFAGIGTRIGESVNAWFTTKYWTLETINFSNIGSKIATAFNNAIAEIDFEIIGRSITQKFTILGDLIISAVNTIDWGEVGSSIGELIRGAFDQLSEWISGVDWVQFGSNLYKYLLEAVEGLDFAAIAESLFKLLGAAIGAAVGLIGSFVNEAWQDIKEYFAQYMPDGWDSNGEDIINGILEGVKNAITNIGTWIKTNVWDPFVAGIKSAFGIASPATTMVPYGEDIGEGIKNGIKNPFQNIKDWVQTNILDKIQSALDSGKELVANIKAKVTEIASDAQETVVEVKAKVAQWVDDAKEKVSEGWKGVVESVQDKIDTAQKIIGGVIAEFNSFTTNLTSGDRRGNSPIINGIVRFTQFGRAFTSGADSSGALPILSTIARFFSFQRDWNSGTKTDSSGAFPLLGTIANFIAYNRNWNGNTKTDSSGSFPLLSAVARFFSFQRDWNSGTATDSSGNYPLLGTIAKFLSSTTAWSSNPVLSTVASFISGFAGWKDDPVLSAVASIVSGALAYGVYITVPVHGNVVDWSTSTQGIYGYASGGAYYGGGWHQIPQAASGGNFHGTLFWAGENGAEVVGHAGGRTEVLNRSQLASTMYASVRSAIASTGFTVSGLSGASAVAPDDGMNEETIYRAFLRALNDSDMGDRPIELDGNRIYQSVVTRNRQNTRLTGVNAMA